MPKKVIRRRRRNFRKKYPIGKPRSGLNQGTYLFKRRKTQVVSLVDGSLPTGWTSSGDNGVYRQWEFTLGDVNDVTDFSKLFKQYKICGVKLELSFNSTNSAIIGTNQPGSNTTAPGAQLQIYTIPNRIGHARTVLDPLTEKVCLDTQACKKRLALNGGRPLKMYMRTNQLNQVFASTLNTDYTKQRPRYISTGETGTQHYGLEMYINRVDGQPLSTGMANNQSVRVTATYYIACKGVN